MASVSGTSDDGDEIIGIGDLARLTGLSVTRLRRYHDLGLLVPARVDPLTGYRSYSPDQIATGRRIQRLRSIDLPLDDVQRVLTGSEAPSAVLARHRRRLEQRIELTASMVDDVDQLISEEHQPMSTTSVQLMEIILRVEDVEATVAFYREVFEMEFRPDDHNSALPLHYDACGGSWDPEGFFMFTIFPAAGCPTTTSLGFGVPDVDETWRRACARGAKELSAPRDSGYVPRDATFEDGAGNRVNVYQRSGW
jgi:DNA-binding transcriptional MerR regulator